MTKLTVSQYLGMLDSDAEDSAAWTGLTEAIAEGGARFGGKDPTRLLEFARAKHEARLDFEAAARLIELEVGLVDGDPDFAAALSKELGRLRREELIDDEGALAAYQKTLEGRPGDLEVADAIAQIEQSKENWKDIASRFVEEAQSSSDEQLKVSLLVHAASLVWQYAKKKTRDKDSDKLFKRALEVDGANRRAVLLYERTLRAREMWSELGLVLMIAAESSTDKNTRIAFFLRCARLFSRKLADRDTAANCYEHVVDFDPNHDEALSFLVEYHTERQQWDHLVALYEDVLPGRARTEGEAGILLQLGMVHWRMRGATQQAEPHFARLRKLEPAHPGAISFYRAYCQELGDYVRLVTILSEAQRHTMDDAERLALAIEVAELATAHDETQDRAIDAWKLVEKLAPQDERPRSQLRALYRKSQKWNALAEALRLEVERLRPEDVDGRIAHLRELVGIYKDKLRLDAMVTQTYAAILQLVPDDVEALDALSQTYEALSRWSELVQTLARWSKVERNNGKRVDLLLRVAKIWLERFTNHNQATEPLEELLAIEPGHVEARTLLRQTYAKRRSFEPLFELLGKELALTGEGEENTLLDLHVERARLAAERLSRPRDAIVEWKAVLALRPGRADALDALEQLAEKESDWQVLADVLQMRTARASDPAAKVKYLSRLGGLLSDQLADASSAAMAWQEVLELDPKNAKARKTLRDSFIAAKDWVEVERLFSDVGDLDGLADVLGAAAERETAVDEKIRLSLWVADLCEGPLGAPKRATRSYERVLAARPDHPRAVERLLPIYEKDERWADYAQLLERRLDLVQREELAGDAVDIMLRLERVAAEKIRNESTALHWAKKAYGLAPSRSDVRKSLEFAATRSRQFAELCELLEARLIDATGPEALELHRSLAAIYDAELREPPKAVAHYLALYESESSDGTFGTALERLYRGLGEWKALEDLLVRRLDREPANKAAIHIELARLAEEKLHEQEAARAHWWAALETEPSSAEAQAALERLTLGLERWDELARVLEIRAEQSGDRRAQVDLWLRRADVLRDKLKDPRGALSSYAQALETGFGRKDVLLGLERLRELPEVAVEVQSVLERAYEQGSDFEAMTRLLESRLSQTKDAVEKRELRLRLADLMLVRIGRSDRAYQLLEDAFLDEPGDSELWDRLAEAAERAQKIEALATAYTTAIESADLPPTLVLDLCRRAANLYDGELEKPESAEGLYKQILKLAPEEESAFGWLRDRLTAAERWAEMETLYEERLEQTNDVRARVDLLVQLCFLREEMLAQPTDAMESYEAVLELEPEHPAARRALDRLYTSLNKWSDLEALLRQEVELGIARDPVESWYRIGELNETKLGKASIAVDDYERVVLEQPTHLRAQAALERLLAVADLRQRVARVLEGAYETQGAWKELVRILRVTAEAFDADLAGYTDVMRRVADLEETRVMDPHAAFGTYQDLTIRSGADVDLRGELHRLAGVTGNAVAEAETLEKAIGKGAGTSVNHERRVEIWMELGALYEGAAHSPSDAERVYSEVAHAERAALDHAEASLNAAHALEGLYLASGDSKKLALILERQTELEPDAHVRGQLWTRIAELSERSLNNKEEAIRAYRERVALDPGDVDGYRAIARLEEELERWQSLVETLGNVETLLPEVEEAREFARHAARVLRDKLKSELEATVAYETLVEKYGPDRDALSSLHALHRSMQSWRPLAQVIESEMELSETDDERAGLFVELGELEATKLSEPNSALERFRDAFALVPHHVGARAGLESIFAGGEVLLALEAARMLADDYRGAGDARSLVRVLGGISGSSDSSEALAALTESAGLSERDLGDAEGAFELIDRALRHSPAGAEAENLMDELHRLAEKTSRFEQYSKTIEEVMDELSSGLVPGVRRTLASIVEEQLRAPKRAIVQLECLLRDGSVERSDLVWLSKLYFEANDHENLARILGKRIELAEDAVGRTELRLERAAILEEKLRELDGAALEFEEILAETENEMAHLGLERLYPKLSRYRELSELYERQLSSGAFDAGVVLLRLARVYLDQLRDPERGLDTLSTAAQRQPLDPAVVQALEECLQNPTTTMQAAKVLENVYTQTGANGDLGRVLGVQLSKETDPVERLELYRKLTLATERLGDAKDILKVASQWLLEEPESDAAFSALVQSATAGAHHQMAADSLALASVADGVREDVATRLAQRAGAFYEQAGQISDSIAQYERSLELSPGDGAGFAALESLYLREQKYNEVLSLYVRQSESETSDDSRCTLLLKAARTQENALGDLAGAVGTFKTVLELRPRERQALESVERLLATLERWQDLADHLRFRIDQAAGGADEVAIRLRLASVLTERLKDFSAAIDEYEEALRRDSANAQALDALEKLALEHDDDTSLRAAESVAPFFEQHGQWPRVLGMHEVIASGGDEARAIDVLLSSSAIAENSLNDVAGALEYAGRAWALDARGQGESELLRLAEKSGHWDAAARWIDKILSVETDPDLRREQLYKLARVHDERRGDPRSAIDTYERILKEFPEESDPLDSLESLATMIADWDVFVSVVDRKLERTDDPIATAELCRQAGSVLEDLVRNPLRAVAYYERAVRADESDELALEALDRLYTDGGRDEALAIVLAQRVEIAADPEARLELMQRLAALLEGPLGRPGDAIPWHERVLSEQPDHPATLEHLTRLYERVGRFVELVDTLQSRARLSVDDDSRAKWLLLAGGVVERELRDIEQSLQYYEQALALGEPGLTAVDALERIFARPEMRVRVGETLESFYAAAENHSKLAELYRRRAEVATDPSDWRDDYARYATTLENGVGDKEGAFEAWNQILLGRVWEESSVDALLRLAPVVKRGQERTADAFALVAGQASEESVACDLLLRVAKIAEHELRDDPRAVEAYRQALTHQPSDEVAVLSELERLYTKTDDKDGLLEILPRVADHATDKAERLRVLGLWARLELSVKRDQERALALSREILELDSGHAETLSLVRSVLAAAEQRSQHDQAAAELLEYAFRDNGDRQGLAEILRHKARRTASEADRVEAAREAAAILAGELGRASDALAELRFVLESDPSDTAALDDLERIAAEVDGGYLLASEAVESASQKSRRSDSDTSARLLKKAAAWRRDQLADLGGAEKALRDALKIDERDIDAHEQLIELLGNGGRERDLVEALRAVGHVEDDSFAKAARYREAARVAGESLADARLAEECFVLLLAADPSDCLGLRVLVQASREARNWPRTEELLTRLAEHSDDPEERTRCKLEAATILGTQLRRVADAVRLLESVLDDDPAHERAFTLLSSLFEKEAKWQELRGLLERRVDVLSDALLRREHRVRLAKLLDDKLKDAEGAVGVLQDALGEATDPVSEREVEGMLEVIFRRLGRKEEVIDLVVARAERALSRGDKAAAAAQWREVASLREHNRDPEGAADALRQSFDTDASNTETLTKLVAALREQRQWDELLRYLEIQVEGQTGREAQVTCLEAAQVAEKELDALDIAAGWLERAMSLGQEGDKIVYGKVLDASRAFYERTERFADLARVLELELPLLSDAKKKAEAWFRLGQLQEEQMGEIDKAIVAYSNAADSLPSYREPLERLLDLYDRDGKSEEAAGTIDRLVQAAGGKRSKDLAALIYRAGRLYEELGRASEALERYDNASKMDPTHSSVLIDLGRVARAAGDLERGQRAYRALLLQKLEPSAEVTKADVYLFLAEISLKQGDKPKAISMAERALGEDARHSEAQALLDSLRGS